MTDLPPSLAAKPNIPWADQTLDQLRAERAYWQARIDEATGWGAAVGAAAGFRDQCDAWIVRRQREG